jgi:predicted metal-binding transcription factor (methanogenesis marker protein 9)
MTQNTKHKKKKNTKHKPKQKTKQKTKHKTRLTLGTATCFGTKVQSSGSLLRKKGF